MPAGVHGFRMNPAQNFTRLSSITAYPMQDCGQPGECHGKLSAKGEEEPEWDASPWYATHAMGNQGTSVPFSACFWIEYLENKPVSTTNNKLNTQTHTHGAGGRGGGFNQPVPPTEPPPPGLN